MCVGTSVLELNEIENLAKKLDHASAMEIIRIAVERIPNLTLACSFGAEDMVLVDMLMQVDGNASIFYLDTDLLFQETYVLRESAIQKYGLHSLRQVRPTLTLGEQAEAYGDKLWKRDPNACCVIRKVTPLTKILQEYDGWITGIRRDQAQTRTNSQVLEWDTKFELVKVNPLAFWTEEQMWAYIRCHDVPYNPLHDKGYPSIGCTHCTKSVKPGEDPRSGRWSGFEKTECGLHK
ncbi:phosphoadenylyl-sulfate reductase [Alicyclobacillaceae bacterium I2511]|nr:phosphoadenylyl-sulfate reductase [Alicyclobacillaceae bacterium I2511]